MGKDTNKSNTKRILIPLLYDYYMFDYFKDLSVQLVNDEFDVTILSFDERVLSGYAKVDKRIKLVKGSRIMRILFNRSGNLFFRSLLWMFGWLWCLPLKFKNDFVIVPWDNKPLWYIMTRYLPAMSCHNSTEYLDFELTLEHMHLSDKDKSEKWRRLWLLVDHIIGGRLLPRVNDEILYYNGYAIIDKLMGFRSPNYLHGYSSLNYLTVTGEKIKNNLLGNGLNRNSEFPKVIVTGSPSYEGIMRIKNNFTQLDKEDIYKQYGIKNNRNLYSFFLSPSSFTKDQIDEVVTVVTTIRNFDQNSAFILKFHPKTQKGDPDKFRMQLSELSDDLVIITDFGGDELNAIIILSSKCVVQKQGTVGFIAMLFNHALISYNLVDTDYFDDMYELVGGSFHCKTKNEIIRSLNKLDTDGGKSELKKLQNAACNDVCYPNDSPCTEISKIIQSHFS